MKLHRYWAKGSAPGPMETRSPMTGNVVGQFSCWGWSDASLADAEQNARQRAAAVEQLIRQGTRPDSYLYGDRPIREHIIDEWQNAAADTYAAVTLNAYGCQVLNTAGIMFVDVDLPASSPWEMLKHGIKRLLGNAGPSPREQREADAVARLDDMILTDPRCGARVYRTYAGLRYLLTHAQADPRSESTLAAMDALGADPLYVRLCQTQECFRARITPKPWRCGISGLSVRYPWRDDPAEAQARAWIETYTRKTERFATCAFLEHLGSPDMDDETARVVDFHDQMTKATSNLPLA